jgi:NitT/TauT family transport system permease protein
VRNLQVTYGHHLTATGLGAYIAQAARVGDFPEVLIGVVVMSVYVVAPAGLRLRHSFSEAAG